MIKRGIKRGFTLVELLIVVAILALLSGAAYVGIQRAQVRVMNEKVVDDLAAIVNALEQYKRDEGTYPNIEDGSLKVGVDNVDRDNKNVNCFAADTTYSHDCEDPLETAFIQTQVDNQLLTKRYLQEVPTDPRTQSRYMYGVTVDGQFFQVAGNYLMDDGTYVAKVRGNVEKGYSLPSLMRAFDGPNFVIDGEGYLPYSPDHLNLTARLEIETGTVLDGDNQQIDDGATINPGSRVKTEPLSSAILYFSDGSITYLDPETEILVMPNTEVLQNDEDGIVTKIRLKLFQGKIWSKVARLAQESEFNVQTTGAIAGVRGTEFGINHDATELIVLSGTVVAREMTTNQKNNATGTDKLVDFDSSEDFVGNGKADGDGTTYQQFTVPQSSASIPPGSGIPIDGTAYEGKYYKGPFNNNYRPRILKIDTTGPPKIAFKFMAGVNRIEADYGDINNTPLSFTANPGETELSADVSLIIGKEQVKFLFVDGDGNSTGLTDPAVDIVSNITLIENDIYNLGAHEVQVGCGGAYASHTVSGPTTVVAGSTGNMYKASADYTGPPCSQEVTCDWQNPLNGTMTVNGEFQVNANVVGFATIDCKVGGVGSVLPPSVSIISELNAKCWGLDLIPNTSDDVGYWDQPACWILADESNLQQNCDYACNQQLSAICVDKNDSGETNWDDDGKIICNILVSAVNPPLFLLPINPAPIQGNDASDAFAPYLFYLNGTTTNCYARHSAIDPADQCAEVPQNSNQHRICRCI